MEVGLFEYFFFISHFVLLDLHFEYRIYDSTLCPLCVLCKMFYYLTFLHCTPTFHKMKGHLLNAFLNRTNTVLLYCFHAYIFVVSRFAPGHSCLDDSRHHCVYRWAGCGLYGNEVHHLWRRRQGEKVPYCHGWRHHPSAWM